MTSIGWFAATGANNRLFALLAVKKRQTSVVVCCLYDTGSPYTFLTEKTLSILGYKETILSSVEVEVHGTKLPVYVSHGHFKDIDVVGQNFLSAVDAQVAIDYANRTFTMATRQV